MKDRKHLLFLALVKLFTSIYIQSPTSICSVLTIQTHAAHLERLKPAKPEWEASSMSGVTIRSIMSVNTVKVGTTMKSMKPEDKDVRI